MRNTGEAVVPENPNSLREVFVIGSEPEPVEIVADIEFPNQPTFEQTSVEDLF